MKIALIGYGKMGRAIEELAQTRHEVVVRLNSENSISISDDELASADVAIEFSTPNTAFNNIMKCLKANLPVVSGTTGWLDGLPEIEEMVKRNGLAFLYASNFSIGMNIFFYLNKFLAINMARQEQYKVDIEEIHHTEKKDSPSGTAITLANDVIETLDMKDNWVNHTTDKANEVGIISKRVENVNGTHTIKYESDVDSIKMTHEAHSRKGFAGGALLAAEWIIGNQGIFTMEDVLDLKKAI
ncbi:MAG: 4-hydroxy-tetrahydrodipicolinate reductase [Bacteroidetes bacterium]|nr:4-hydroxy-tetrahydrodipicolinate reductase [Bacteroidota bacterium]